MTVVINLKNRLNAIVQSLQPILAANNIAATLTDQPFQTVRNNNVPTLFVGFQQHRKMDFQSYANTWNEDTQLFDVSGRYSSMNTIFFDLYPTGQTDTNVFTGLDICQNMVLSLDYNRYYDYNMCAVGFSEISNLSYPKMIQSTLKQRWRFTVDFMCYDDIIFNSVPKADALDVQITIGLLQSEIYINLDS